MSYGLAGPMGHLRPVRELPPQETATSIIGQQGCPNKDGSHDTFPPRGQAQKSVIATFSFVPRPLGSKNRTRGCDKATDCFAKRTVLRQLASSLLFEWSGTKKRQISRFREPVQSLPRFREGCRHQVPRGEAPWRDLSEKRLEVALQDPTRR